MLSPDLLSGIGLGNLRSRGRDWLSLSGRLELEDWEGIPNEAGDEVEAYLPSAPPSENGMILRVTIGSEPHRQVQYRYLSLACDP